MTASATALASILASATEPDAVRVPDPDIVSPGFAGFLTVFVIACVTVLLIRSMTGHMRKARFLADEMERAESEGAEGAPPAGGQPGPSGTPSPTPGSQKSS